MFKVFVKMMYVKFFESEVYFVRVLKLILMYQRKYKVKIKN